MKCLVDAGSALTIGLGNASKKPIWYFNAEVKVDTLRKKHKFLIVSNLKMECNVILGYDFIKKFKFIADLNGRSSTDEYAMEVQNVFEDYNNISAPTNYQKDVKDMIEAVFQV